jgi:hypothetical protein
LSNDESGLGLLVVCGICIKFFVDDWVVKFKSCHYRVMYLRTNWSCFLLKHFAELCCTRESQSFSLSHPLNAPCPMESERYFDTLYPARRRDLSLTNSQEASCLME